MHNLVLDQLFHPVLYLPIPADGIRAPPAIEAHVRRAALAVPHDRLIVAVADVVVEEAVGRLGSRAHLPAEFLVSVQRVLEGIWIQPYLAMNFYPISDCIGCFFNKR